MSWLNRTSRSAHLSRLFAVPLEPGVALLRASGRYVGTAMATGKQRRISHAGLGKQATADATLYDSGLVLHRQAAETIFIPSSTWIGARVASGLGGKAASDAGLLVLRWRLDDSELDTGFAADDKSIYPEWVEIINTKAKA
jgi:hypothetical protein